MTTAPPTTSAQPTALFVRSDYLILGGGGLAVVLAALTHFVGGGAVLPFVCSAVAVTLLASLVGRSVVRAALMGSILANLARCWDWRSSSAGSSTAPSSSTPNARAASSSMVLSVAAMVVPSLAHYVHTPGAAHEKTLSLIVSVVLLVLFALTLPASLRKQAPAGGGEKVPMQHVHQDAPRWPLWLAVGLLALAALLAAFVSDWFVVALEPAMDTLHISDAFAGLVIVAIAGNAIENIVGVQLAAQNRSEYAFSIVINSPIQIALVLAPLLVILSSIFGFAALTLVFPPMLVVSVVIAVILTAFITFDGESTWIEGAALIAVYAVIATSFWWG